MTYSNANTYTYPQLAYEAPSRHAVSIAQHASMGTIAFLKHLWADSDGYPDASIGEDLSLLSRLINQDPSPQVLPDRLDDV